MFEINPDAVVHETDLFVVDVGMYPKEDLECYRVWNKQTSVLEYAHSISFYAFQWADAATKILRGETEGTSALPEVT